MGKGVGCRVYIKVRCRGKILLVILFGMIFIEIMKYNNSVTDQKTVYRYTLLVKQAVSLQKLIMFFFLTVLYKIPPAMPIGSFLILSPSSAIMLRLSINPL